MARNHKTTKKTTVYNNNEETPASIISEPAFAYTAQHPNPNRTIGLMGLAGKKEFSDIKNENDFIGIIRAGLPKIAMTHLMEITDISLIEMAAIVHTSDRTLRRYTPNQRLSQDQSERTIEIAKLYSRGEEVFGNIDSFKEWMDTALFPLNNKRPKEFLDTSLGINMLMDELGRIEHGVLA